MLNGKISVTTTKMVLSGVEYPINIVGISYSALYKRTSWPVTTILLPTIMLLMQIFGDDLYFIAKEAVAETRYALCISNTFNIRNYGSYVQNSRCLC